MYWTKWMSCMIKNSESPVATVVAQVIGAYPQEVQTKLYYLRKLVLEAAAELDLLDKLEETLKWGEPSYLMPKGSTIRMDWKTKTPNQYALYFKCTSKLVSTFRTLYSDVFEFEKNRAIVFQLEDNVPAEELKECIKMALMYHTIKQDL